MNNNCTLSVYSKGINKKVNGITISGTLGWVKDIDVNLQPYSTALLAKNYGYNIEVNRRIMINYFDVDIKIGTIFKYQNENFKDVSLEVKTIPWDLGHMELMGLEVS